MDKVTVILVVLGATWGAIFNVLKIVEMKNGIRNLVLDIDSKGKDVSLQNKKLLLWADYAPLAIGVFLFCLLFSGGLIAIPFIYDAKATKDNPGLNEYEWFGCFGAASFTGFAMFVDAIASWVEIARMRAHIKSIETQPKQDEQNVGPKPPPTVS